jgi:hypothetical protein
MLRLETSRLNSLPSWVKSPAIDYALTRACFHAGEIRVLDSSLCTKLSCIGEARWFVGRSFKLQKRSQFFIDARNETASIVALRVRNPD